MLDQIKQQMAALDAFDVQSLNDLSKKYDQVLAAGRASVQSSISTGQIASAGTTYNSTSHHTVNMPVYTNMAPTAISQSMAIIAASMP